MHAFIRLLPAVIWFLLVPTAAYAQASITGVARDSSGAVLPGVTVEASSPALIEKVRSVVTDDSGQYRIITLPPGSYTVSFTLPGFSAVRREGVELTGSFTATVNADLRVGAVEETIMVTGETPLVDVQSTTQQRVIDHEVSDAIPTGRLVANLAVLIPGVSVASGINFTGVGLQDVGGASGDAIVKLQIHGSRAFDQRVTLYGVPTGMVDQMSQSAYVPNPSATHEVAVDTGGISAESSQGGIRINVIPRDGGNTFGGVFFGSFATKGWQSNNLTEDLKSRGLQVANTIKQNGDINPGFGGPLKRDRLWFYTSVRYQWSDAYAGGMFVDRAANDPNAFFYDPDFSQQAVNGATWKDVQGRVTWQAAAKHKIGVLAGYQSQYKCPSLITATASHGLCNNWPNERTLLTDWTSPLTNRVLLEAALFYQSTDWNRIEMPDTNRSIISFVEQSNATTYKTRLSYTTQKNRNAYYRAAMSYVTGAHFFKVGVSNGEGWRDNYNYTLDRGVSYRFNNGVPNQITLSARPYHDLWNLDADVGVYAQDKWTIGSLTLSGGVRYDYYKSHFPANHLGPGPLVPNRDMAIPRTPHLAWHDVTPRTGASYDVFGNGKTALKATLNKYVFGEETSETLGNPYADLVLQTTRTWGDTNRNFIPDCDLTNPADNGECRAMANPNFGKSQPGQSWDPAVLSGFGKRGYNWEFSAGVQHELLPRVSTDVTFFRRWFGNFSGGNSTSTPRDDRALSAADFDTFCIPAPTDSRLPGGGGNQICGLYDVKPERFGIPADVYATFSDTYGKQVEHWNGVDVTVNARLPRGAIIQGGLSTGRTSTDNCEIVAKLPEMALTNPYCHVDTKFLTQVKLLGSYTIPRVDVRLSATLQSIPGPQVAANFVVPSAVVAQSLGRPLSGGAANVTVNVVEPGSVYGERLNQVDVRFARPFTFGSRRLSFNLDIYNALNVDTVVALSNVYATWLRPQSIVQGRFAKISTQLDF